ncbi:MAG TPA: UDP-N-acetylmuramoyl-L-alanyl-D-glutamate--2,6-diaminopimelate ligase [Gammaproteobacteria bacterium]|nr:UDP-N-acetylmuramoyl-L-alanyl-D-glutamate--2,6-diaminopimelate ligase [Gammaproteobacteria bacterium]
MTFPLSHVLAEFYSDSLPEVIISDLTLDSRLVKPGSLFFALPGTQKDGRHFIDEAIQKGAHAILTEAKQLALDWQNSIPIISLPDLKNKTGKLAARFYDNPAQKMRMIGVTGTSGKTSCTQFIASVLHHLNISCGMIGTLGNGLYGDIKPSHLTTPDAITLQKTLAEFFKQGAKMTAMEVSSHSLDQGRVNGVEFDVGIFTNLTRDHLDYHHTMEAYGAAKKRLFDQSKYAIVNADDAFGREILKSFKGRKNVLAYSSELGKKTPIYAEKIQLNHSGIKAHLVTPWGDVNLTSALVGQFNLDNLLAIIAALCVVDIPLHSVMENIQKLQPVEGRMQAFGGDQQPLVIVDYAHKPDALEKVLMTLRQQCQGKLYCIFGCGGDRDRGKRPLMAKIAEHYADQVIVTDDNPRHENPKQIIQDILQGFTDSFRVIIEHDRAKAIYDTIQFAVSSDCVLIAGKGAETYQLIGDEKFPFSDAEKVKKVLNLKGDSSQC